MKRQHAFTLIELLVVITIISILVSFALPNFDRMISKTRSIVCLNNLRQIGMGVRNYINDNDNTFPIIEMSPNADPIYDESMGAKPMLEVLGPYGITANTLRCPTDVATANHYASESNSYQWLPTVDDENGLTPFIYRRGVARLIRPSRIRIVCDQEAVHNGLANFLYADGSTSKPR